MMTIEEMWASYKVEVIDRTPEAECPGSVALMRTAFRTGVVCGVAALACDATNSVTALVAEAQAANKKDGASLWDGNTET